MNIRNPCADFDDQFEEDALQRNGPKQGITISLEQICDLFARHLHVSVKHIQYIRRGYNNRVFSISADNGKEYILKVCGRYWQRTKTDTEVVGLILAKTFTHIPVPDVLAWNSDKTEVGAEYIIMSKVDGVPLDSMWLLLSSAQKEDVVRQLADVIVQMKTSPSIKNFLHGKGNCIGNFQIDDPSDVLASCHIVPLHESGIGPFCSFVDYYVQTLSKNIQTVKADVQGIFTSQQQFLPRLENFLKATANSEFVVADTSSHDFLFFHGDFTMANVIVSAPNETNNSIVINGILDWEWCGPHLPEEEFGNCDFLKMEETMDDQAVNEKLRNVFFSVLGKSGLVAPENLPYIEQRRALNALKDSVAPWYLTDVADKESGQVKEWIAEAVKSIDTGLQKLGF